MKAKILDGKKIAEEILEDLKKNSPLKKVTLAIVQVGDNRVSETYIKEKQKIGTHVGVMVQVFRFPADITQKKLEQEVVSIGEDQEIAGLLVQLPLPKHMDMQGILDYIPIEKDVDVLSSEAFGRFTLGTSSILPPTVGAVSTLLKSHKIAIKGRNVVIVGAGRLVGLPLAIWFMQERATVSVANEHTKELSRLTRQADILVSGVGKTGLIRGDMVKRGVVVVDAGTSVEQSPSTKLRVNKIKGDVDFESVSKKASFITPVPGGVGPLTVACLLRNVLTVEKTLL